MIKESYLYKKLKNKMTQCRTCAHYCVIGDGKRGICGVRENRGGKLYSLVYGKAAACNIDPIEKKPLFHFLPGTKTLSIATVGCNFSCQNCQNWSISQEPKILKYIRGEDLAPKEIVELAKKNRTPSISYTYTEPTVFLEYSMDTMKLAKKENIKNVWVTNGFLSKETFDLIKPYLDAANVDLKGFSDDFYQTRCGGKLQPVLDSLKRMKKAGVWVEITTLAIPGLSDSGKMFEGIAKFIKKELGSETPWHISRFSGMVSWKLQDLPDTPIETLKKAYEIGKKAGLKYVYIENVSGLDGQNTYCPKCGEKMIARVGYVVECYYKKGKCAECGEKLNIIE
jgi:pyruvate formate lyase activating enzyme